MTKHRFRTFLALCALTAGFGIQSPAMAADDADGFNSPIEGVLQSKAENGPQRAIAEMVEEICPNGRGRGVILSQDLQDRCTDVVQAVRNTGDLDGATNALQDLAAEEVNTIATSEIDASAGQVDAIGARLSNLRAGGSRVAIAIPGFGSQVASSRDGWLSGGAAGDNAGSGLGFFVNGNYAFNDKDQTSNESGFESDTYGVTAGIDVQVSAPLLLGAAFTYTSAEADIVANGGNLETDSFGGFGYGTYSFTAGWYLDGMVGYTSNNHDQARNLSYTVTALRAGVPTPVTVNQVAFSDLDSREIAGSLKLGFDQARGNWVLGPYARLDVADVEIDGYNERMSNPTAAGSGLALQIDEQSYTSIMTAFGASAGYLSAQSWGTWYPQVMIEYVHEFDNDAANITGRYVDAPTFSFSMPIDDPDRNFAHMGVSSSFVMNNGLSAFAAYQAMVGYEDLTTHLVQVGLRVAF